MIDKKDQEGTDEGFWEAMERGATVARTWPSWMKAGINLNEKNFVTFRSTDTHADSDVLAGRPDTAAAQEPPKR